MNKNTSDETYNGMTNLQTKDIKRLVRKAGPVSTARNSSRVKGWCSGWEEGFQVGDVYPWASYYVRNGFRLKAPLTCRTQTMTIHYSPASSSWNHEGFEGRRADAEAKLIDLFDANDVEYKIVDGSDGREFHVEVANPYSETEVKRLQDKWNRVISKR